jgi:uncharacterized protein (DUF305 family)
MNNKIVFGIIGGLVGLVLGVAVVPATSAEYPGGGFGMMGWRYNRASDQRVSTQVQQGGIQQAGTLDKHFIEQMIPHHDGAIAMANLALLKATHPEIKTLAEEIIEGQTKEIGDMRSWYRDWFGGNVPEQAPTSYYGGMMSRGGMHMGSRQDIDSLQNATDFDREFIEQMIPHHQMAIMMARMLGTGTNRSEMEQLAEDIEDSQTREIRQMQAWYEEWYQ